MPIEDLAVMLREHRKREKLSLRAAAQEAGVSFNTLARIERGQIPDTGTLVKVIAWLDVSPDAIVGEREIRVEATPEIVGRHLRADPALTDEAAARISRIVADLYSSLAAPSIRTAVHLRAARTFTPEAGRLLAELLSEMEQAVTDEP